MTTQPPTDQQLDDIEARADVATDGPWERYEKYGPDFFACTTGSILPSLPYSPGGISS